jgi:hypothetical protein
MILDPRQARLALGHLRPWRRVLEALEASDDRLAGVAYSIGDIATYRTVTGARDIDPARRFFAHHLSRGVLAVRSGRLTAETAPRDDLLVDRPYDDLDDVEWLLGEGQVMHAGPGQIMVPAPGEAVRVVSLTGRTVLLRLTVEGGTSSHPDL